MEVECSISIFMGEVTTLSAFELSTKFFCFPKYNFVPTLLSPYPPQGTQL